MRAYTGNTDFSVTVNIDQMGRKAITINSTVINNEVTMDFNSNLLLIAIYFPCFIYPNVSMTQSLISYIQIT